MPSGDHDIDRTEGLSSRYKDVGRRHPESISVHNSIPKCKPMLMLMLITLRGWHNGR